MADSSVDSHSHRQQHNDDFASHSINCDTSVSSSELFGSSRELNSCCSEEFKELHLIYQPLSEEVQCKVKLSETDILPVLISYIATCPASQSTVICKRSKCLRNPNESQSLFQETLNTKFDGAIDIKTVNSAIVFTLIENVETIRNIEEFQKEVLANYKLLEEKVTIQLLELNGERFGLAIKHFLPVLRNNPTIKLYRTEDEYSLYIAFQTQNDKELVDNHTAVVKDQEATRQEKPLSKEEFFKTEAYRTSFESQNAEITIEENRIIICGFQEDVNSTAHHINKVLQTSHCDSKRLDDFVVDLLQNADVFTEVKHVLADTKLNVWLTVSGHSIIVVGSKEIQVTEAIEKIVHYFSMCKINMPDYLLDSSRWETIKAFAVINSQSRLLIDDTTERPLVIIKGTSTECRKCADSANEFKRKYTRVTMTKQLTKVKCDYFLKYQSAEESESQDEEDLLRFYQESDKAVLIAEGTVLAHSKLDSKLKEISTQKFWIADESAAERLKELSERAGHRWNGTVHIYKNRTKLFFKTGRIEEEQVDVVVNSAANDLNLRKGINTVTQAIYAAAGERAQASLQHIQRPVPVGSVVVGHGGGMTCKAVFHAVLERFDSKDKTKSIENLKRAVTSCLDKATKVGFVSIAFPALCSGVHEYPVKVVAETMMDAIVAYSLQNELQSLEEILIVFLKGDIRKRMIFEDVISQRKEKLESMIPKEKLCHTLPWSSRYFCHITAATHKSVSELTRQINTELMEQTIVKRLETTE